MHASKTSFLDHMKWLRKGVQSVRAEFILAGDSLQALVREGQRHAVLHPRFLTSGEGVVQMTPQLDDAAELFLGWLPYPPRRWPIGSDTLAFKRFARSVGLPTPDFFTEAVPGLEDVIVTRTAPALGRRTEGPFAAASERPLDASKGEYYERSIPGDLVTVWFWNGDPVCAERQSVPEGGAGGAPSPAGANGGGETVDERVRAAQAADTAWIGWMRDAGRRLLAGIPEGIRATTLFTVDAVLDAERRPWLLQMDGNPIVHPMAYPAMITSLLPAPERQVTGAPAPQPA